MNPFCYLCFVFVCHTVLFVPCSLVVTCWERADLLDLLYVMFSCVFVTFPYGVLSQVWYLIVLIPDLCFLPYFLRPIHVYGRFYDQTECIFRLLWSFVVSTYHLSLDMRFPTMWYVRPATPQTSLRIRAV